MQLFAYGSTLLPKIKMSLPDFLPKISVVHVLSAKLYICKLILQCSRMIVMDMLHAYRHVGNSNQSR